MATETRTFDASNVTTNGVTSLSGNTATVYDSSSLGGEAGSIFFNDEVTLNEDFTVSFQSVMTGPDGIAFVMHNDPAGASAQGGVGIGMGHTGIQNGIAVEFDTYFNGAAFGNVDINDNSSVIRDTDFSATNAAGNISTQVDLDPIADLNDGTPHDITISWDADSQTLSWTLDGVPVSTRTFSDAELDSLFANDRSVFLGITGAKFVAGTGVVDDFQFTGNFVCFASGTLIETVLGETPVEDLRAGQKVRTLDNGLQEILWIGHKTLTYAELSANPKLRPILIKKGALGANTPDRDLLVSRQHRILVRSKIAQRMFGSSEILVPAAKLLGLHGVFALVPKAGVT